MSRWLNNAGIVSWALTMAMLAIALLVANGCSVVPARVEQSHSYCWLGSYQDPAGNRYALECLNNAPL
jgi:hypothetical protein